MITIDPFNVAIKTPSVVFDKATHLYDLLEVAFVMLISLANRHPYLKDFCQYPILLWVRVRSTV